MEPVTDPEESSLTPQQKEVIADIEIERARTRRSILQNIMGYLMLILGIIAVASSWWSIRPSSESRYQKMLQRHSANPDSVSALEWVQSKDDEGFTALSLLIIGVPAFLLVPGVSIFALKFLPSSISPLIPIGCLWLILGALLHAMLWTH